MLRTSKAMWGDSLKRDLDDSVERDGEEGMHHVEQVKPVADDAERGVGDDARVVEGERFTQESNGAGRERERRRRWRNTRGGREGGSPTP